MSGKGIIFPNNYNVTNDFNEFNWTISSNKNKTFKLNVYIGKLHGYVYNLGIYDGEQQIAVLGVRDRMIDYVFYSDSNKVLINYKFDLKCVVGRCYNFSSFYIGYEELDRDISPDQIKQTSTCNDFIQTHSQDSVYYHTIVSPWMSLTPKAYGSNLNCSWTVARNATAGKRVHVIVYIRGIGKNDILSIYSGNYTNKILLNSYTNTYPSFGLEYKSYTFNSNAWNHFITFNSDYKNSGTGFLLLFTETNIY